MDSPDDSPQIGPADVDREALDEKGTPLALLIKELGVELGPDSDSDAPTEGWRVLRRHRGVATLLGRPLSPEGHRWRLARIEPNGRAGMVRVHPDTAMLQPSRAERRRPLEFRWPALMNTVGDLEDFAIDIVNTGSTRWFPNQDSFHVIGVFTEPGVTGFDFGWVGSGTPRAVPLDPQEYARAPIHIDSAVWGGLEPGDYDLHPIMTGLSLRGDTPLRVTVSADMITRHGTQVGRSRRTAEERRESIEAQIGQLRSLISAGASLTALAETVAMANNDEDAHARIMDLCRCDEHAAQTIYESSLRVLRPGNKGALQQQIEELTHHLERF